jgi:hypothetical protein
VSLSKTCSTEANYIVQATPEGYPNSVAQFNLYNSHIFKKSEFATINIAHASYHDAIFLILVFLYSEAKRVESQVRPGIYYLYGMGIYIDYLTSPDVIRRSFRHLQEQAARMLNEDKEYDFYYFHCILPNAVSSQLSFSPRCSL